MEESEGKQEKPSFKEILTDKAQDLNKFYNTNERFPLKSNPKKGEPILLSEIEKERIYHPWRFFVIVKLMDKKISYQLLKSKIMDL